MNVFQTHTRIVSDYATYIRSFLKIADPQIREVVEGELGKGKLWPEPLLQFNPSFEMYGSLEKLAQTGDIHPDIRDIFKGYSLYRHQVDAIKLGTAGKDFIVTSGTGSGKSLTYIGSIFHHILSNPGDQGVVDVQQAQTRQLAHHPHQADRTPAIGVLCRHDAHLALAAFKEQSGQMTEACGHLKQALALCTKNSKLSI